MYKIIEKSKIALCISIGFILIGMATMMFRGLNFGIDFKGGTKVVIELPADVNKAEADEIINKYAEGAITSINDRNEIEIRAKEMSSEKVNEMFKELKEKYTLEADQPISEDTIGASVGKELTKKSLLALLIAFAAMLVYIAIRFEFDFGLAAIMATLHDVLFTLAIYAIFFIPVNTPFIAALLTIVGYSMNDTIVIFDRIRETKKRQARTSNTEIANISLTQTMARSINTSLTTLVVIASINIFVPSVREFSFPLLLGIACGAYSSIFVAAPFWVMLKDRRSKKNVVKTV